MDQSINDTLPPCRVCDAQATGLHYGVITCEACKAFFRRGLSRGDVYECPDNRSCDISNENRNSCAYCRFQKCIKMGMSKDAIKTGRYSYEMRTFAMRESRRVRTLVGADEKLCTTNPLQSSPLSSTESAKLTYNCDNAIMGHQSKENRSDKPTMSIQGSPDLLIDTSRNIQKVSNDWSTRSDFNMNSLSEKDTCVNYLQQRVSANRSQDYSAQAVVAEYNAKNSHFTPLQEMDQRNESNSATVICNGNTNVIKCSYPLPTNCDINRADNLDCDTNSWRLYDMSKLELYEYVIARLYEKHKVYAGENLNISESLSQTDREHLEMIELRKQIFGSLNPMSSEEYMKFYTATGIDVDGRREMMVQCLTLMEQSIKQHIEFAKVIPGFGELSVNDQIALTKATRMDFFMISCHRCFNAEHKLFRPDPSVILHYEDWIKLEGEFVEPIFNMQQKIKNLNLEGEETAVLGAIIIMATDECEIQDRALVEQSQDFLLECLFYLFDKYHPEETRRFSRIINCLTELRTLREDNLKSEERLINMWWGHINFPPLLWEYMT